ncbi:GNAT family N-acetyltransferase [Mucilaginibacter limnophilus]|uniref:GNAT family N-acetyltransferase n=1 Tax=Mucilaginibacter limnophilus TaxID=1932778 RepID=A0A3S2VJV5_9SPHI|nr:GNAT family N-acetyltransferase [Mucilaginibacter limnophilus]RVT96480.1 GNAT family N-acetyltransferase [Mucilaginibacter limnophilus]
MQPGICIPSKAEYPEMIEVWEASVRATHHFLDEVYIQHIKSLLPEIFGMLDLYYFRHDGEIAAIMGLSENKIEMLFVDPQARGTGIGKQLVLYAIQNKNVQKVDVNEQNEQAVGFYRHMGFHVTGRTETDSLGKPHPILEMELQ